MSVAAKATPVPYLIQIIFDTGPLAGKLSAVQPLMVGR